MNDSYANTARLAREMGPGSVALHPDDAAARRLEEGDEAKLTNDTGEILLKVGLLDEIPVEWRSPAMVVGPSGRQTKQL